MKTLNTEQLGIIEAILLQTYNLKYDNFDLKALIDVRYLPSQRFYYRLLCSDFKST